jgi:hypothetical protein
MISLLNEIAILLLRKARLKNAHFCITKATEFILRMFCGIICLSVFMVVAYNHSSTHVQFCNVMDHEHVQIVKKCFSLLAVRAVDMMMVVLYVTDLSWWESTVVKMAQK